MIGQLMSSGNVSFAFASNPSSQQDVSKGNWQSVYPFESNYLQLDGARLHFVDENTQGGESPVLMVHGNPTWSFYYRRLISSLSDRYRTIAVDHVGCGLSDKPANYDYCLQTHIDNLSQLVETLNLTNVTLMAHDWGGAIGLGALQKCRERFSKIILFNTGAFPPPFIPFRIRVCRWPVVGKIGVQGFNLFARAATVMATERKGGLRSEVASGLIAPYDRWANRVAIYNFVKDIPLSKGHRTWSVLDRIEQGLSDFADWPIQLVWGMKDWCFRPECLERFESHWPKAEVHRLENAGHYVIEDEHQRVDQLVREFLSRHSDVESKPAEVSN